MSKTEQSCNTNWAIGSRIRSNAILFSLVILFATSALATSDSAQSAFPDDRRHDTPGQQIKTNVPFHTDVDLALITVTVKDKHDHVINGLRPDNFRLFEDNVEQEVVNFSTEDVPVSIGLIFDFSGSMRGKLGLAKEAAAQFLKTTNSKDEVFLVGFGDHAVLIDPFTSNVEDLQNRLSNAHAKGSTALLDAVQLGLLQMRSAGNARKALLIISDGGDNHSRYTEDDLKRILREADTQLYAIGLFQQSGYHRATLTDFNGPLLLDELTRLTGGSVYTARKSDELEEIASKIGAELHNQYILGYQPSNKVRDAQWRKVSVKLRPPDGFEHLSAHAKRGYYARSF